MADSALLTAAREGKPEALKELAESASTGLRGYSRSRDARRDAVMEGLQAAKDGNNKSAEAFASYALVAFRLAQGEPARSCAKSAQEAAKALKEAGEKRTAGRVLLNLAQCHLSAGFDPRPEEASRFSREALALFDAPSDRASAMITQAEANMASKRTTEAIAIANEAIPLLKQAGNADGEASMQILIASAHLMNKDFIHAQAAASEFSAASNKPQSFKVVAQAVEVEALLGAEKYDNAKRLATEALQAARSGTNKVPEASLLHSLAQIHLQTDAQEALEMAGKAMALYLLLGEPRKEAAATLTAAKAHLAVKGYDAALQLAMQIIPIAAGFGDKLLEADAICVASRARLGRGQPGEAFLAANKAHALFKSLGDQNQENAVSNLIAEIKEKMPPPHRPTNAISLPNPMQSATNAWKQAHHCVVWNNAMKDGSYMYYVLEFIRFLDDLSRHNIESPVLVCSQGCFGNQVGTVMPSTQKDINGISVWGMVRTARLEMPRLDIRAVDIPTDADGREIARVLCDATEDSGDRDEVVYGKVCDGEDLLRKYGKA